MIFIDNNDPLRNISYNTYIHKGNMVYTGTCYMRFTNGDYTITVVNMNDNKTDCDEELALLVAKEMMEFISFNNKREYDIELIDIDDKSFLFSLKLIEKN